MGNISTSIPEDVPPPGPGSLVAVAVVLVPEEISGLLHHILPGWETLAGMAAFKHLINIQIYSSHFNLNSMHIIK